MNHEAKKYENRNQRFYYRKMLLDRISFSLNTKVLIIYKVGQNMQKKNENKKLSITF